MAEDLRDPEAMRAMLNIAASYEKIAEQVEAVAQPRGIPVGGALRIEKT